MSDSKARVFARGSALCPDFAALDRGVRRMIGREFKQISPGQWGWTPKAVAEAVEKSREVAFAIADGDLWAADEATASWVSDVTGVVVLAGPLPDEVS